MRAKHRLKWNGNIIAQAEADQAYQTLGKEEYEDIQVLCKRCHYNKHFQ